MHILEKRLADTCACPQASAIEQHTTTFFGSQAVAYNGNSVYVESWAAATQPRTFSIPGAGIHAVYLYDNCC